MGMLEGVDESTCEELEKVQTGLGEIREAVAGEIREEVEEIMARNDDKDLADALEETDIPIDENSLKELRVLEKKVRYTTSLACGLSYTSETDTDYDPDGDGIPEEIIQDTYEAVDEAGRQVRDTTPEYIVSDDIAYRDMAGEENQKRVFQDHVNRTLDFTEGFADDVGVSLDDREMTGTAVAMQIECGKLPTDEAQEECYERFEDSDVKSSGLRGIGETIPGGV